MLSRVRPALVVGVSGLLDHFVGAGEEGVRDRDAQGHIKVQADPTFLTSKDSASFRAFARLLSRFPKKSALHQTISAPQVNSSNSAGVASICGTPACTCAGTTCKDGGSNAGNSGDSGGDNSGDSGGDSTEHTRS
jgi:hypothetical protein